MSQAGLRHQLLASRIYDAKQQLKILNSLTRTLDTFQPSASSQQDEPIRWYSCGPTVYDVSHLGHARCYITFDIIRRILVHYFGLKVNYVLNITDIDDKIIKRARSNHLFNKLVQSYQDASLSDCDLVSLVREARDAYSANCEALAGKLGNVNSSDEDKAKLEMMNNILKDSEPVCEKLTAAIANKQATKDASIDHLNALKDILAEWLDRKSGHSVTDPQIFKALAIKYEQDFFHDMRQLNVMPPDSQPRVSEYIERIGEFIKRIEQNGFAYQACGSVYFDTEKFDKDPKHSYAKLVREAYGSTKLEGGEGELSQATDGKRSPNDFALWKKSKPGEPSWKVLDYEPGRPGWHIECSAMASHLLGHKLDIHSGGCDLKFPHHDNEIAQSEAYHNTGANWVNFFLHSGHLSIAGCKMSKSLKNFVTIKQALQKHSARQLRFAFLLHKWSGGLDYSESTMSEAIAYEKRFKELFMNVTYARWEQRLKRQTGDEKTLRERLYDKASYEASELELFDAVVNSVDKIDSALCDNFDTVTVLKVLMQLVRECNKHPDASLAILELVADYTQSILGVFGLSFEEVERDNKNMEACFGYVRALAQFRCDIRRLTKDKEVLSLCDTIRDKTLPDLGVRLEDRDESQSFRVRFVDAELMASERNQQEHEKRVAEERARLEKVKLQQQREDKMKIPPNQMFRHQTDKYSKFDDEGMPTHDNEGKEISKSALKKLQRLYKEQKDRYERYMADRP